MLSLQRCIDGDGDLLNWSRLHKRENIKLENRQLNVCQNMSNPKAACRASIAALKKINFPVESYFFSQITSRNWVKYLDLHTKLHEIAYNFVLQKLSKPAPTWPQKHLPGVWISHIFVSGSLFSQLSWQIIKHCLHAPERNSKGSHDLIFCSL